MAASHDVEWVARVTPGAPDAEILRLATTDDRVLLTFDKDYGELAHSVEATAKPAGIILIRGPVPRTRDACRALVAVITERDDWAGHFSVILPGRIRRRPLRYE
jgi:predicted nuclease of predicted toxin-antitoxin system